MIEKTYLVRDSAFGDSGYIVFNYHDLLSSVNGFLASCQQMTVRVQSIQAGLPA